MPVQSCVSGKRGHGGLVDAIRQSVWCARNLVWLGVREEGLAQCESRGVEKASAGVEEKAGVIYFIYVGYLDRTSMPKTL